MSNVRIALWGLMQAIAVVLVCGVAIMVINNLTQCEQNPLDAVVIIIHYTSSFLLVEFTYFL